tara:strand:+ start:246 stop:578 length:333 start_codon:yes stop_codon:yes gene_type:complete
MSNFFDSEIVRENILELEELQEELNFDLKNIHRYDLQEKREHIERLKIFLEKQKIFFFRMTLSNDPHVSQIKSNIIKAAHMFGYSEIDSMEKFFNKLDKTIEKLEQSLDR